MDQNWLFDVSLSFHENLEQGPFGDFDTLPKYKNIGEPQYDFFGTKVYSPFGIAAGPLPRTKFVSSALNRGFDIVTFKTVRTREYPCHPAPNVIPLDTEALSPEGAEPIKTKDSFGNPLTIANSFGIPSFDPSVWQPEIKQSFQLLKKGQALLAASQGTVDRDRGHDAFINDHIQGVGMLVETGANVIEINLSCPNEGHADLLCFDLKTTKEIVSKIRKIYPHIQVVVKIAYMHNDTYLKAFVKEIGILVAGITAINTIPRKVVDQSSKQAFPGAPSRLQAGVSGAAIKHLAIDMVKRLRVHRQEFGYDFKIIGVGGVLSAKDFHDHRAAGADFVMGLTGVMWNPGLAAEIKKTLNKQ